MKGICPTCGGEVTTHYDASRRRLQFTTNWESAMLALADTIKANIAAVLKEYFEALEDGDLKLAKRIRTANPDLTWDYWQPRIGKDGLLEPDKWWRGHNLTAEGGENDA